MGEDITAADSFAERVSQRDGERQRVSVSGKNQISRREGDPMTYYSVPDGNLVPTTCLTKEYVE
jgi:hypothetical protein